MAVCNVNNNAIGILIVKLKSGRNPKRNMKKLLNKINWKIRQYKMQQIFYIRK